MSPREQRSKVEQQNRILKAAAQAFAELGFDGARVDEIARRADVNKAMLYYHVGDKTKLYETVLERNFDLLLIAVTKAKSQPGTAPDRLKRIVSAITETLATIPDHPRIMLREFAAGGREVPEGVLQRMSAIFLTVREVLAEGAASGELRQTNPVITHLMIVASAVLLTAIRPLQSNIASIVQTKAPRSSELIFINEPGDLAAVISDIMLRGLSAEPNAGEPS